MEVRCIVLVSIYSTHDCAMLLPRFRIEIHPLLGHHQCRCGIAVELVLRVGPHPGTSADAQGVVQGQGRSLALHFILRILLSIHSRLRSNVGFRCEVGSMLCVCGVPCRAYKVFGFFASSSVDMSDVSRHTVRMFFAFACT